MAQTLSHVYSRVLSSSLNYAGLRGMASRFLKEQTLFKQQALIVQRMDDNVAKELKKLEKMKKSKAKKNLILEFHKKSVIHNNSFKIELALGKETSIYSL